MNIEHNHKDATSSTEADRIEGDIEAIEHNIVDLTSEFVHRVKSTFSVQRILESHTILSVAVIVFVFWFIFPRMRRKTLRVKIIRVEDSSKC
jgi:hypothetical protein